MVSTRLPERIGTWVEVSVDEDSTAVHDLPGGTEDLISWRRQLVLALGELEDLVGMSCSSRAYLLLATELGAFEVLLGGILRLATTAEEGKG